jgi:tetratricopeptide (TPR) repeat protein
MEVTLKQAWERGLAAHRDGKLGDAEKFYRAILEAQPRHAEANHNLGVLALSSGRSLDALPMLKKALDANPSIDQFWLTYIGALIDAGQLDQAKHVLKNARRGSVSPERLELLDERLGHIAQRSIKKAQSTLPLLERRRRRGKKKARNKAADQKSLVDKPTADSQTKLLDSYRLGDFLKAEELSISLTQEFPGHPLGWKVLAAILARKGSLSDAVNAGRRAAQLLPNDAETHHNLGITLREIGELSESESSCQKAITLSPRYAEAHFSLGVVEKQLGKLGQAQYSFKLAIKYKPDYPDAHNNLGVIFQDIGDLKQAESCFDSAIRLRNEFAEAHNNLGVNFKLQGRRRQAEACFTEAIRLKPKYQNALTNRWQILFDKGDYEAALTDISECDSVESRAYILETLYAMGRVKEVFERVESGAKRDAKNIRIGAFSAFVNKRENRSSFNGFCPDPLSFLSVSHISKSLAGWENFIDDIIEELHGIESVCDPVSKSTRGGIQTARNVNLFKLPSENIATLHSIISREIDAYYHKYQSRPCTFIEHWPSSIDLKGWHVILKQQGYQASHIHTSGWLSGVVYLKVVPSLGKREGAIEFSLEGQNSSDAALPKHSYQPEAGDLVLFPSSLHHRTIPFSTDMDRIVISFDLLPQS